MGYEMLPPPPVLQEKQSCLIITPPGVGTGIKIAEALYDWWFRDSKPSDFTEATERHRLAEVIPKDTSMTFPPLRCPWPLCPEWGMRSFKDPDTDDITYGDIYLSHQGMLRITQAGNMHHDRVYGALEEVVQRGQTPAVWGEVHKVDAVVVGIVQTNQKAQYTKALEAWRGIAPITLPETEQLSMWADTY